MPSLLRLTQSPPVSAMVGDHLAALDHNRHLRKVYRVRERIAANQHDVAQLAELQRSDLRIAIQVHGGVARERRHDCGEVNETVVAIAIPRSRSRAAPSPSATRPTVRVWTKRSAPSRVYRACASRE